MSNKCPSCNEELNGDFVFCPYCGQAIEPDEKVEKNQSPQMPSVEYKVQTTSDTAKNKTSRKYSSKKILKALGLIVVAGFLIVAVKNVFGAGGGVASLPFLNSQEQIKTNKLNKLNTLILESSELDADDYTDASWSVYKAALNRGEEIYKSANPSSEEINVVTQNLEKARDGLKVSKNAYKEMPYESVARYPEKYEGKLMQITGEVFQEGDNMLRVATKLEDFGPIGEKYMHDVVYVFMDMNTIKEGRVLEGDIVTIYGECDGVTTYETINGGSVTIPALYATEIDNHSAQ